MRDNIWHILPVNDTVDHLEQTNGVGRIGKDGLAYIEITCPCKCKPTIKEHNGAHFIIHDAFDGRLGVEWANEILNK